MNKKLYLANGLGFAESTKHGLREIKDNLAKMGFEVYEPFEENHDKLLHQIGKANFKLIDNCDVIFAVMNGNPPDDGVCIEVGYAFALNKSICLYRDDFRRCSDSEEYPLNLQIIACLPLNWQKFYYTELDDLWNPEKALCQWSLS